MQLNAIFHSRKSNIIIASILLLLIAYIIFRFTFPEDDPIAIFLSYVTSPVLYLAEKFANMLLHWTGSSLSIQNHSISQNNILVDGYTTQIMYKKVTFFYILILWLTRATAWKKISFTGIYLLLGFLFASIYIVAGAYYFARGSYYTSVTLVIHSFVFVCMNTILLMWYLMHKKSYSDSPVNIFVITKLIERKLSDIIIILYGYSFVKLLLGLFSFHIYIYILLKSSQLILGLLGYDAIMEPSLLIGSNGSVSVYKTCVGFMTMFFFISVIFITGNKQKRGWQYMIYGIFILNLVNVFRIVLLFIHVQKYGDYMLAIDVHDLYNYIFYSIVFILWVIWFERYLILKAIKSVRSFLKI